MPDQTNEWRTNIGERGFILVVVLGLCLTLAMIAASFSRSVQVNIRAATVAMQVARADALAEAGLALAVTDLAARRGSPLAERRFVPGSAPVTCGLDGAGRVSVAVTDEAGRINLNTGNLDLLTAALAGLGAAQDAAAGQAAAILDYTDADDEVREGGAEADAYLNAGRLPPKNAPFESVDELDRVLGLPEQLVAALKPLATVYSGVDGVDPAAALRAVRRALSSGLTARDAGFRGADGAFGAEARPLPPAFTSRSDQRVFRVRAAAMTDTGTRLVRSGVVELPAGSSRVVRWLHVQQDNWSADDAPAAEAGGPPC